MRSHDQYPAIDPAQPQLDCSKKIILITGGGRGIGKAIATAFAKAHAKGIALLGRTRSSLEEAASEVKKVGGQTDVHIVTADITVQSQVIEAIDSVIGHFGRLPDVLINNAGGLLGVGLLADLDIDEYMKAYELNVRGPLTVLQTYLRANRHHSPDTPRTVINMASGGAHLPFAGPGGAYGSSKLAISKITEYAHHELPSWNIFNMQPGVVATDLAAQAGRKAEDQPELPAGFAVWLVAHPDARKLNGKFIWANWDINEVLERVEEIQKRDLLTLTLKGWAEDFNAEDLKRRAGSEMVKNGVDKLME
jgi:NAD(P)-dependent dehydrogenase (short-subunit alcohol dehydrogenase family)